MRYFMDECGEVPDECWKTVLAEDGRSFGILERSMVCTNAYIEGYLRHVYNPPNSETHIWNRFDIVEAVQMIISRFAAASQAKQATSSEMAQLMKCIPSLNFECAQLLVMLIMTGSRRGEALGACWEDIDWSARTIHLQRVVRFRNNAAEVSTKTKTSAANRTVSVWDDFVEYLGIPEDAGFIIDSHGEPLTERMYRIRWGRLMRELESLGVEFTFTAHQLRHTYATIAAKLWEKLQEITENGCK